MVCRSFRYNHEHCCFCCRLCLTDEEMCAVSKRNRGVCTIHCVLWRKRFVTRIVFIDCGLPLPPSPPPIKPLIQVLQEKGLQFTRPVLNCFLFCVLAPPSCQTKSSGKPEISPQEFSHLQQQLQDMKEQV